MCVPFLYPYVKYNTADVKRVEQDGNISIRMNYANTCQMNLLLKNKRVFLVTRINHGKGDAPLYRFYLSQLDYKEGKFIKHLKVETAGVDISKSEFKCANDQSLVFLDEDFLYGFNLD